MANIKANCRDCDRIYLTEEDVTVHVCAQNLSIAHYTYRCPHCGSIESFPCSIQLTRALREAGCKLRFWNLPDELLEPKEDGPITMDDVLDFHLMLQDDVWTLIE